MRDLGDHDGAIFAITMGRSSRSRWGETGTVHGLCDKHAVKQVDRLVGNEKIDTQAMQMRWAEWLLEGHDEALVNLDWTEFDSDGHSMLVLSIQTPHGRAMPLMWTTVRKASLKGRRNEFEDALLVRFAEAVPAKTNVTVVADRGFSDQKLYAFLTEDLGFDFVIRFRGVTYVTDAKGVTKKAHDLVKAGGRMRTLRNAAVTADETPVAMVALVHEQGMKEPWCLATSLLPSTLNDGAPRCLADEGQGAV